MALINQHHSVSDDIAFYLTIGKDLKRFGLQRRGILNLIATQQFFESCSKNFRNSVCFRYPDQVRKDLSIRCKEGAFLLNFPPLRLWGSLLPLALSF